MNQGNNDRTRAEEQRETLLTLHQLIPENGGKIQNNEQQSSTTENPALRRYTHFHSEDAVSVSESDVTTPATPQQVRKHQQNGKIAKKFVKSHKILKIAKKVREIAQNVSVSESATPQQVRKMPLKSSMSSHSILAVFFIFF